MTSTSKNEPALTAEELRKIDAYWKACNYLSAGMIYLRDNPLLKEPLRPEHIKNRLLGHWGSDPGQTCAWAHLNRVIRKYDLDMIYLSGPGHGAPAVISNCYLEGTYAEIYPEISPTENLGKFPRDVMRRDTTSFRVFSPDENASNRLQD